MMLPLATRIARLEDVAALTYVWEIAIFDGLPV
jgi:hypothetical protein